MQISGSCLGVFFVCFNAWILCLKMKQALSLFSVIFFFFPFFLFFLICKETITCTLKLPRAGALRQTYFLIWPYHNLLLQGNRSLLTSPIFQRCHMNLLFKVRKLWVSSKNRGLLYMPIVMRVYYNEDNLKAQCNCEWSDHLSDPTPLVHDGSFAG